MSIIYVPYRPSRRAAEYYFDDDEDLG